MNVRRHPRVAQRSDEDGVEVARQHLESVGGNGGAVDEVAVGPPVEGGELQRRARGPQHIEGQGNDFFADAVSGDDGDALVCGHELEQ